MAKVNGDCELECEKSLKARCKEEAEIHSEARLTLKAPVINILGVLNMANYEGEPTPGTLKGTFNVVQGDVTTEAVSLRQHQHENSGGSGVGGKPVGG